MAVTIEPHVVREWIERVPDAGRRERVRDELAMEEPLEIRVDGRPLAVAMRTPIIEAAISALCARGGYQGLNRQAPDGRWQHEWEPEVIAEMKRRLL